MTERKSYSSNKFLLELPYLIEVQKASYEHFLQANLPPNKRLNAGLERVFRDKFPMQDAKGLNVLKYEGYFFGIPKYSITECRERGLTYAVDLWANLTLQIFEEDGEERRLKEEIKNEVRICELPQMTDNGSFIINGAERVVVSQLHRSPGVSFDEEILPNGRSDYKSRIIPLRGAWVEFNTDGDMLYLVIDRKKKMPATTMLRCIGFETTHDILALFYKDTETVNLREVDIDDFRDRIVFNDVIDEETGDILVHANDKLDDKCCARLRDAGIAEIVLLSKEAEENNALIHNTLLNDKSKSREDALNEIYKTMHQSQESAPNAATAEAYFQNLFLDDPQKYDLGDVGRYRLNAKVYTPAFEERLRNLNKEDFHFIFTDKEELDITNRNAVYEFVELNNISIIVNCAAYTAVDKAEEDAELCELLNHIAPSYLAEAIDNMGGSMIQISTDYVFDGKNYRPYTEDDLTNPQGVYGRTKLAGEEAVIRSCVGAMVIRTAWLYSSFGSNFVKTMIRLGKERDTLGVVADQIGTPTYARDLAACILEIIKQGIVPGVYHYSNEGATSWYDFTKSIHRIAGINSCNVMPIHTEDYPTPAKRPHFSVLDKSKIKNTFNITIPWWEDSLKECIKELN